MVVFVVNFIAIIPLAGMLSYATEEIALRTGEVMGGLLNASFGYAFLFPCLTQFANKLPETPSNLSSQLSPYSKTNI